MQDLDTRTIINEFGVVIDESLSMSTHRDAVPQVIDGLVAHLARKSQEMKQETRISVYAFNSRGTDRCLVFDTDVLRIPSIKGMYHPQGNTALIDCTCLAIDDLRMIPTKYGERSFWVDAVTDGQENNSRLPDRLRTLLPGLPEEWTVTAHVPDQRGVSYAVRNGFHPENVQLWNTAGSFEQIGESLRQSADRFMAGRAQGIRGYSRGGLFSFATLDISDVERNLTPLTKGSYTIETNKTPNGISIREFVPMTAHRDYHAGVAFYQFGERSVKVQANKQVFVQTRGEHGPVYGGPAARRLLDLPDYEVTVQRAKFPDYSIFVQSNSYNSMILPGQRVLVLR